jgi:glycosyltransferase involved in cell wall biosynthesis
MVTSRSLSVSIISFNEEDNIGKCLEAIQDIATEIIVVDSHSTDRTVEIALHYGATVVSEDWKGFTLQKNSALDKCRCDWILALDCDEVVSPTLKSSIISAVDHGLYEGFWVNRRTYFLGRWINHAWYPDWNLRLIKRGTAQWQGGDIHECLRTTSHTKQLDGDLYHYSFKNLQDCLAKTVRYATIAANAYHRNGRSIRWHKLILNPLHGFFKHYILKRGFLDGWQGFILSVMNGITIFLKYSLLWEAIQKDTERRRDSA